MENFIDSVRAVATSPGVISLDVDEFWTKLIDLTERDFATLIDLVTIFSAPECPLSAPSAAPIQQAIQAMNDQSASLDIRGRKENGLFPLCPFLPSDDSVAIFQGTIRFVDDWFAARETLPSKIVFNFTALDGAEEGISLSASFLAFLDQILGQTSGSAVFVVSRFLPLLLRDESSDQYIALLAHASETCLQKESKLDQLCR
jgi:hypothetical protein